MTVSLKAWREAWRQQVRQAAETLDLPQSMLTGLPRLMWDGNELELQGRGSVLEYAPECIYVAVNDGCVRITGSEMQLTDLEKNAMRFRGRIVTIEWIGEGANAV